MQIIYHYCDVAAFFNILKNKKIWLSGVNNLNDHQEVEWTIRKIHSALKKLEAKFPLTDIEGLWNQIQQSRATPYVCSFSSEGDLLSQWRAYARDGSGFAIGFNADYFPNSGKLPHLSASLTNSITRLVRIVVVPIELNNERAAMKDFSGSIRTSIQRQSGGQVVAAGERSVGGGLAGDRYCGRNPGALAHGCAVQARPRAGLDSRSQT
jgi:hypothetical protein